MKILMVCLGNICRSPLAEGILQQRAIEARLNWTVESAGTNGYHNDEPPHPLSQKVARLHGIDISRQRSRKLVPADFERFDILYAMAEDVMADMKRIGGKQFDAGRTRLFLDELHPGQHREVPDPWYGPEPGYHEVFDLIDGACGAIVTKYGMNKNTVIDH
jgi:protein-tyrosine phosphatase